MFLLGLMLIMMITVMANSNHLEERTVILESMGIVLDYGDPIPISPLSEEEGMALWKEVVERFERGEPIRVSDLPFPVIEMASISMIGENVEITITESDLDILVNFYESVRAKGRSLSLCGDFLDALKYAELYFTFWEQIYGLNVSYDDEYQEITPLNIHHINQGELWLQCHSFLQVIE